MIECYRIQSGWYVVRCNSCDIETYHDNPIDAEKEGVGHEKMHDMDRDLNRYFGLVGASIAYKYGAHLGVVGLS